MKLQNNRMAGVVRGIVLAGTLSGAANLACAGDAVTGSGANRTTATSDYPLWCGREDRDHISSATGLADSFEEVSTNNAADHTHLRNVKWVAQLYDPTYRISEVFGSPVVAGGKVYIGGVPRGTANNNALGVLWCFRESDGALLWKLREPHIPIYDNARGIMSTPALEGDRVYLLGMIGEVLCLNANGLANGNTGPFQDEEAWLATDRKVLRNEMTPDGRRGVEYSAGKPCKLEKTDADIIWRYDMVTNLCWSGHCGAAGSILIHGDYLYVPTCCDWGDAQGPKAPKWAQPLADWKTNYPGQRCPSPSLVVLDKKTGALLAVDETGAATKTHHGAHASPAWGRINGREMIVLACGCGMCYGIDPSFTPSADGKPGVLKTIWQFDSMKQTKNRKSIHGQGEMDATSVIYNNHVYFAPGGDLTVSGPKAFPGRLVCVDATQTGDITETGCIWNFDDFRQCAASVVIENGLLYAADASGMVYCMDPETGHIYWSHKTAPVWAVPLVADGKVYIPTYGSGLVVLATGKEKKVIYEANSKTKMAASPAVANGVLYFADMKYLYAVTPESAHAK